MSEDGWKQEALQHRANLEKDAAKVRDFVELFERVLPDVKEAKKNKDLCMAALALHHLAMSFHHHAGPKAMKLVTCGTATVFELPKSFGNFGKK
jgi:hypothetical protein